MMKKLFLSCLLVIALGLIASPAYAQLIKPGDCDPALPASEAGACGWQEFFDLVNRVIDFLIYVIAFPLAGLLFLWGGFVILTSGGSPEKVSTGKNIITRTIIALVVVLTAFILIKLTFTLLGVEGAPFFSETLGRPPA